MKISVQLQQREEEVDQPVQRRLDQRGRRSVGHDDHDDVVGEHRVAERCRRSRHRKRESRQRHDDVDDVVDEGQQVDRFCSSAAPAEHRLCAEG